MNEQEKSFALLYLRLNNAEKAYERTYKCQKLSPANIKMRAEKLLARTHVQEFMEQMDGVNHEGLYSQIAPLQKDKLTEMLLMAYEKAAQDKRGASAMISACLAIAKLNDIGADAIDDDAANHKHKDLAALIKDARARLNKASHESGKEDTEETLA